MWAALNHPRQLAVLLALALSCPRVGTAEVELLPLVSWHLEAARYHPTELDQHWTGWIGAGAGLVRVEGLTLYFSADVESILGWERRPFEATQVNYHLEPGLRRSFGDFSAAVFFHHVSRHAVDRPKPEAVDWNVLGLRLAGPLTRSVRFRASVGHTTLASLVGYRWELTAGLGFELQAPLYGAAGVRLVTVDPDPALPRDDFADVRAEAGGRWRRGNAQLELFAAFERRNDVYLLVPAVRNRLLVGFRIGDRERSPATDIYGLP
jgi:hypothetical protein